MSDHDKLIKFCEEFLGRYWEINIAPNKVTVSFLYEAKDAMRVRQMFYGTTVHEVKRNVENMIPAYTKGGMFI